MASTSLSTLKTTISTASPTTSSKSTEYSNTSSGAPAEAHSIDDNDQASSGDEWDMEIGNLIIDLEADLEKDEMKEKGDCSKNDARNSNNNNSAKGSSNVENTSNSQAQKLTEAVISTPARNEAGNSVKTIKPSGPGGSTSSGKPRSKSKKSNKMTAVNKYSVQNTPTISVTSETKKDSIVPRPTSGPSSASGRSGKSEDARDISLSSTLAPGNAAHSKNKGTENVQDMARIAGKSSKSGRSYKKHSKNNNNNSEKKTDNNGTPSAGIGGGKDSRDKPHKAGKSGKHQNQAAGDSVATTNSGYSMATTALATFATAVSLTGGTATSERGNSPSFPNSPSNFSNHCATMATEALTRIAVAANSGKESSPRNETIISRGIVAPLMSATSHMGKHRKTSSVPLPMKYQTSNAVLPFQCIRNSPSPHGPSALASNSDPLASQNAVGKRERNTTTPSAVSKKIKLEKEGKAYRSGMTPNDVDNVVKLSTGSPTVASPTASGKLQGHITNWENDYKMTIGQQKISDNDTTADKKTNSTKNPSSSVSSSLQQNAETGPKSAGDGRSATNRSTDQSDVDFPHNNVPTPGGEREANTRTVGTVTTYADVGVSTEPESLGPCEPGTSVHLSGIVWHETESGVLVVNLTWRNRSYVGTLLDATKHDWAPPRIPDADSDVEFRVKSGRPKRQRGNGSNGSDVGRKGRKSAMANNFDEYKCSPSSNKRRNAKMSESDACSGNDGEICATPSKSTKRARMSRTATAKHAAQKAAIAVKESTSGDGTSGSGSSACSSPVFMDCPYANCKKRYKDNNALKYHEAHAHQGEEAEDAEKSGRDADSPAVDSAKDSDNASTKSVEEMAVSDSTGSPKEAENTPALNGTDDSHQTAMETHQIPNVQVPFVVTQPPVASAEQYSTQNQPTPMQSNFIQKGPINEEARNQNQNYATEISVGFEEVRPSRQKGKSKQPSDGTISPYTLTDSQGNDSISLKTHHQAKPTRSYHMTRPTTAYAESTPTQTSEQSALMETTSAVDSESAQAVKTLLQLQENSQDQLPGLTPYSLASQAPTMSVSSHVVPKTSPLVPISHPQSQSTVSPTTMSESERDASDSQSKTQTTPHNMAPPSRGIQLPRMSVGIFSSRNQCGSKSQFVSLHGSVTTNSSQDRVAHHPPSGLKTVKGKTVPIPTDPQQTLTPSSQPGGANVPFSSAGSSKKQKRKKMKTDLGKSPTEPVPKPSPGNSLTRPSYKEDGPRPGHAMQDQVRVKQEHHHHIQTGGANNAAAHHRPLYENKAAPVSCISGTSNIKVEPGTKPPSGLVQPLGRGPGFTHPNVPHPHRQQMYPHPEHSGHDLAPTQVPLSNKNNNNKMAPHARVTDPGAPQGPQLPHARSPSFPDTLVDSQRGRDERPRGAHLAVPPRSSHSLPGSRSLTPVSQAALSQPVYNKQNIMLARDCNTPTNLQNVPARSHQRRPSKETSPPPPLDQRLTVEGAHDTKRSPVGAHRGSYPTQAVPRFYSPGLYSQFGVVPGYEVGYQAQFMTDPRFQQHYENVIQQEMQKDHQKLREEHVGSIFSRPRSTPSPNSTLKPSRSKTPPRSDERRGRGDSPTRVHRYPPQTDTQIQLGQRSVHGPPQQHIHVPRGSPAPHGSYLQTPGKVAMPAMATAQGLSPHPQATPSPMSGNRPPRPSSETERFHRREHNIGERPSTASRTSNVTPNRRTVSKEGHPELHPQSPDKGKSGPPSTSVYTSPGVPVQLPPGTRTPVQYYTSPYQAHLIDPRSIPPYAFPTAYMFHPGAPIFHGPWPHGAPSAAVPGGPEKAPLQSPHAAKPSRDRSSSGSRSPCRDEGERRPRVEVRGRDGETYLSSKERRISDGPPPARKSATPDPKAMPTRNSPGEENSPLTQRHHHTHHHIHEGLHPLIPAHQYPYPMTSAVLAGPEATSALAQYPKRELQ